MRNSQCLRVCLMNSLTSARGIQTLNSPYLSCKNVRNPPVRCLPDLQPESCAHALLHGYSAARFDRVTVQLWHRADLHHLASSVLSCNRSEQHLYDCSSHKSCKNNRFLRNLRHIGSFLPTFARMQWSVIDNFLQQRRSDRVSRGNTGNTRRRDHRQKPDLVSRWNYSIKIMQFRRYFSAISGCHALPYLQLVHGITCFESQLPLKLMQQGLNHRCHLTVAP